MSKSSPGIFLRTVGQIYENMANKGQQPPYLHLAELTASQFLDIWKHFDADGEYRCAVYSTDYDSKKRTNYVISEILALKKQK